MRRRPLLSVVTVSGAEHCPVVSCYAVLCALLPASLVWELVCAPTDGGDEGPGGPFLLSSYMSLPAS